MISTRELKAEIEHLTKQNQSLSDEIQQLKQLLKKQLEQQRNSHDQGNSDQQNQNNQQNNNQQQGNQNNQSNQNNNQNHNQNNGQQNNGQNGNNGQGQNGQSQNQGLGGQGGQGGQNNQQQNMQIANIANEFLQLKGLTNSLETKMNNYISSQTGGGQLKQQDVAYLVLNMMNGMIDWTIDYVLRGQSGSGN